MTTAERAPDLRIDGGSRACGELLLHLHARLRGVDPGTLVELIASDPAAPIDIPAWCHLTGHLYCGVGSHEGSSSYLIEVGAKTVPIDPERPWHRESSSDEPKEQAPRAELTTTPSANRAGARTEPDLEQP